MAALMRSTMGAPCHAWLWAWDPGGGRRRRSAPYGRPAAFFFGGGPHPRAHCSRAVPALRTKCVRAFAVACGFPSVRCGSPLRSPLLPSWSPALPLLCALRVLPPRCACACSARPLRRGAPGAASRARSGVFALGPFRPSPGTPLGPSGRGSAARPLPARCALGGRSLPPGRCPLPSLRCGSPLRSPLLRSGAGLRLPSVAASSRGRPLARLRGRLPPAPGRARRCAPLLWAFRPGALLRACCARLLALCGCCGGLPWGSPLRPPAPPPPLGAPGCAWPCWGACGPPCRFAARLPRGFIRHAVRFPIVAAAGKGQAGLSQPLPLPLRYFWRKALTMANICATMVVRGPLGRFGAPPARVSGSGLRSPVRKNRASFFARSVCHIWQGIRRRSAAVPLPTVGEFPQYTFRKLSTGFFRLQPGSDFFLISKQKRQGHPCRFTANRANPASTSIRTNATKPVLFCCVQLVQKKKANVWPN